MQRTTSILQMFPQKLRLYFEQAAEYEDLAEIRIRCRQPVMLRRGRKEYYLAADGTMQEERPEECLVFEDVPMGILAGKNAGMRVCAVEDTFSASQREEKKELADYYIESYDEIPRERMQP